jgi:hypothetical protein
MIGSVNADHAYPRDGDGRGVWLYGERVRVENITKRA